MRIYHLRVRSLPVLELEPVVDVVPKHQFCAFATESLYIRVEMVCFMSKSKLKVHVCPTAHRTALSLTLSIGWPPTRTPHPLAPAMR